MFIIDYLLFTLINKAKTGQTCPKGVYFGHISNINTYVNIMGLSALTNRFTRKAAAAVVAGTALFSAASLPAANDAHAGEPQTASVPKEQSQRPSQMMTEMLEYSEKPDTKGIGVFINLQAGTAENTGRDLGELLKRAFASRNVPLEYRINQSRGTTTDVTFYVKGLDFTINIDDIKGSLGKVLAHHQDVWPATTASLDGVAPTKQ